MLKDLNNEFCSRFTDELLLGDKKAKAIGSTLIKNHATLDAFIGEGDKHFFKYSMLGHIYLFTLIILDEVMKKTNVTPIIDQSAIIEERLSRPALYRRLALFSGEISALKLVAAARSTIEKFKNDSKMGGFVNLMEWSCKKVDINNPIQRMPEVQDYHTYGQFYNFNMINLKIIIMTMICLCQIYQYRWQSQ
jgi:hypothetical protein